MEAKLNIPELLLRPAFCVEDGRITRLNRESAGYMIAEGTPIRELIATGQEDYEAFTGGMLCLTLQIGDHPMAATVVPHEDGQLFILEQDAQDAQLQSMPLVAQELRGPLTGMIAAAERLLPSASAQDAQSAAQMNRRIYQMLRIVNNMSDAARFATRQPIQEYVDAVALLDEIMDKVIPLAEHSGYTLRFSGPMQPIYTLADRELLERAVYNLLSNAMKFSPQSSVIDAKLLRSGNTLRFTIEDAGCGIDADVSGSIFSRYLRSPALEDPSHGLGLGMVMVRLAATQHGGTVLIDHPHEIGTRVTMTMAIRQTKNATVRTPIMRIDYAGERDHALIELADILPAELYKPEWID